MTRPATIGEVAFREDPPALVVNYVLDAGGSEERVLELTPRGVRDLVRWFDWLNLAPPSELDVDEGTGLVIEPDLVGLRVDLPE